MSQALRRARQVRLQASLERWRAPGGRFDLALNHLRTFDPKGKDQKLGRPLPQPGDPEHECLRDGFTDLESPYEVWDLKSRQVIKSWEKATFCTASMLVMPGWQAAIQSENEPKSIEFKDRCVYQLQELEQDDLWRGQVKWQASKRILRIESVCGIEMRTELTALPEGESQWRFKSLSMGILDEATKNKEIAACYTAAINCIDESQGGKLVLIWTGVYGSWPNEEMLNMLPRAVPLEEAA